MATDGSESGYKVSGGSDQLVRGLEGVRMTMAVRMGLIGSGRVMDTFGMVTKHANGLANEYC